MVYDIGSLRFIAVNDAAVARYGYSRDEFLNMKVSHARLLEQLAKPLAPNTQPQSLAFRTKNGAPLAIEIAFRDLIVDGIPAR